jgi:hypothetical protein
MASANKDSKASVKKRKKAEKSSSESSNSDSNSDSDIEVDSDSGSESGSDASGSESGSGSESDYVPDDAESDSSTSADEHDGDKSNSDKDPDASASDDDENSTEQPPIKKAKTVETKQASAVEPIISLLSDDDNDGGEKSAEPVAAAADDLFEQLMTFGASVKSSPKPDAKSDFEALLQWGESDAKKAEDGWKKKADRKDPPTSKKSDAKTSEKKRSPTAKCDKCGKRRVVTHCSCDNLYCKECQVVCVGCKTPVCKSHWNRCRARKPIAGAPPQSACGVTTCTHDGCVLAYFAECANCDTTACKTCHFEPCVKCTTDKCNLLVECGCAEL